MAKDKVKKLKAAGNNQKKGEKQGVYVVRTEKDKEGNPIVLGFPGNFEGQVTPTGDLAVIEITPDVGNTNGGKPIGKLRRIIAEGTWTDVLVVD